MPRQSADRIFHRALRLCEVGLLAAPATLRRNEARGQRVVLRHHNLERGTQPLVLLPCGQFPVVVGSALGRAKQPARCWVA